MVGMNRISVLVALAALLVVGCGQKGSGALGAKGDGASSSPETSKGPTLVGKWKGELKMPETSKDDPAAKLGEAFASMMLGSLSLEFKTEDTFSLSLMGIPVEGKVKRDGNKLTLTPETAMGMTVEEAKKQNPMAKTDPMEAEISADGKEITLKDKDSKPSEGVMVFKRREDSAKKSGPSTVSDAEKALVGSYGAELHGAKPEGLSEKDAGELKMAEAMLKGASLELFADNTFHLNFMFEMEGKWHVKDGVCNLKMEKMLGMPEGGKSTSKSDDMNLRVESGGKLVNDQAGPGGAKMAFVKK